MEAMACGAIGVLSGYRRLSILCLMGGMGCCWILWTAADAGRMVAFGRGDLDQVRGRSMAMAGRYSWGRNCRSGLRCTGRWEAWGGWCKW